MTDDPGQAASPTEPGWYADAAGAWWWWDGVTWTSAPASPGAPAPAVDEAQTRSAERTTALIMWIVYLVAGGWISSLVFYLVSKEKAFVRHHAAESLNLTLVLLIPQIAGFALLLPGYLSFLSDLGQSDPGASVSYDFDSTFWIGIALLVVTSIINYAVAITGLVMAYRGRWWRAPLPFHLVRGVVAKGEEPYSVGS